MMMAAGFFSLGAGEAEADSGVINGQLLGLDTRDYTNNLSVKVNASERAWVRHHKLPVVWEVVQREQGTLDWSYYDNQIKAMLADGAQSILLLLEGPVPGWARDPSYGQFSAKAPPMSWQYYYDYCAAAAERYKDVVDFYEIWNEPSLDRDSESYQKWGVFHFGGQVETEYLPMLQVGYAAVKKHDPTAQVICGDLQNSIDPDPAKGTGLYSLLFDEINRPGQDVSLKVSSDRNIVAERPMYFNYKGAWTGGHDVLGANASAKQWYFAEGCTRPGFDEWLCLQNPNPESIQVTATYMFGPGQGSNLVETYVLQPQSRTTVMVNNQVGAGKDVSLLITSEHNFIAERPMYFSYGNGGWTGGHDVVGANQASTYWYFAEGCTRPGFHTWLCLQNPNEAPATITLDYLCGDGNNESKSFTVAGKSRYSVAVHETGQGIGAHNSTHGDVSIRVTSDQPIVAERPMYFSYGPHGWTGGHDVLGANASAKQWYFAEGTTRNNFDEWLCLQNPNTAAIEVTATYMFGAGQGDNLVETYTLPPESRTTIKVNERTGPEKDVSMQLASASEFVAERPMYFSYGPYAWTGGHDVLGASGPNSQWYFAEGCHGYSIQEYVCLQNPDSEEARVDLTFMMTRGEVLEKTVTVPAKTRVTLDVNAFLGFRGSCDMVAVHPYKAFWNWGTYYKYCVQALHSHGAWQEAVVTEVGCPHASDLSPDPYNTELQTKAIGEEGVGGLFANGCRKIWIYKDVDQPPGTAWDAMYYGLFDYLGNPMPAWSKYKQWQSQLPSYTPLPSGWTP
jgi:hypothetical protein